MKAFHVLSFLPIIAVAAQAADTQSPAWFKVVNDDADSQYTFVVQIDDPAVIAQARAELALPESERQHISGIVVKSPAFFNTPWAFHVDPASVGFFDFSVEACDASSEYVQNHLAEVGESLLPGSFWCPWTSTIVAEIPAPAGGANYLRIASAASNNEAAISPGALISVYGAGLTDRSEQAQSSQWPATLGGVAVQIHANANAYNHVLSLLLASPSQVNALLPPDLPPGAFSITLTNSAGVSFVGQSFAETNSPALFGVTQDKVDYAAAVLLQVHSDGTTSTQTLLGIDPATGQMQPLPADPGVATDRLYLSLYGTGFTNATAQTVTAQPAGQTDETLPVLYAGPQGQIDGLDQVNIAVSRTLMQGSFLDLLVFAKNPGNYPVRANRVRILTGGTSAKGLSTATLRNILMGVQRP